MVKKKRKPKLLNEPRGRADHGTNEAMNQAEGLQFNEKSVRVAASANG